MDSFQPSPGFETSSVNQRLRPPRRSTRVVGRERLLTQMTEARRHNCVVLEGAAGSGKSTLLGAWYQALLPFGFDVAWLTLSPEDNDLARWLDDLITSLGQVDPEIVREAALLAGRGEDEEATERTLIALVSGIRRRTQQLVLILDDLHCVTAPGIHETLQWLLDYAPANFHLAMASRAAIPVSLGRLRDRGLALELGMRELRFGAAESEAFLKAQLGEVSRRDARRMHELTDGWVAGLQLLAVHLERSRGAKCTPGAQNPDSPPQLTRSHLLDARGYAEYFEREVLAQLADVEVDVLIGLASCTTFCASLSVALSANGALPAQHDRVLALLARLEGDHLFVESIGEAGGATWYRFNPLFRETLLQRFRQWDDARQREVHRAAWVWFREHGRPDDAVRHAVLAGEMTAAADLVLQVAPQLRVKGELRKLLGLMRLLPAEEVEARVGLRLWEAQLQLFTREFDACAAGIPHLLSAIPAEDRAARFRLAITRSTLAVQHDDTEAMSAIVPELLTVSDAADSIGIGGRNNLLAWHAMHEGEFERSREILASAPTLFVDGMPLVGTPAGALFSRCMMGMSYAIEGRFLQVERICRDVLAEADRRGNEAVEAACIASALMGEVLYEFNELDAAKQLLEERIDVLERTSIPDSVLRVLKVLSAVQWMAGHQLDAFAWLERLEEYGAKYRLDRLLAHSLADQLQRHLQCGQHRQAEAALVRLETLGAGIDPSCRGTRAQIAVQASRGRILWSIAEGNDERASAEIDKLGDVCDAHGWQRDAAHFQLLGAVVDQRRGQAEKARQAAVGALRRGHRLGLTRSMLDVGPEVLDLIVNAAPADPSDAVLPFYASRLQSAHLATQAPGSEGAQRPGEPRQQANALDLLSERETEIVRLLMHAIPNKRIARALSISPETVKWHLKNIYGKLRVSSRDEAVALIRNLHPGSGETPWFTDDPL
ncbi:LuxR C-terminal-related transcriptional regulator [Paraburkholderia pallida]|uniref:LuxR C-terminal-related transcriptional regulator n=1 Tax=Paraburkholderia pallida TaxID=2547399 RepID=UPI00142FDCD6|nr:LuxR C-terminal-related transcriptional regulator [Paraburkholderia pallida]